MLYTKQNSIGDSGAYLLASRIVKMLGWPCRTLSSDTGVDAEIEIVTEQGHATGNIIKVQIKTTESSPTDKKFSIYTDVRHIKYWKSFCNPVIFCGVDLANELTMSLFIGNKFYH